MIWSCVDMTKGPCWTMGSLSGSPARSMKPNLDDALTCTSPERRQAEDLALFAEVPQNVPSPHTHK